MLLIFSNNIKFNHYYLIFKQLYLIICIYISFYAFMLICFQVHPVFNCSLPRRYQARHEEMKKYIYIQMGRDSTITVTQVYDHCDPSLPLSRSEKNIKQY